MARVDLALAVLRVAGCGGNGEPDNVTDTDTDTGSDVGFVTVPASTFEMGCTAGQGSDCDGDETLHRVTLTRAYLVGVTEVTQEQFEMTMGYLPAHFTECGADCPVETVNWHESAAYATAVSAAAGLQECYTCRGRGYSVECSVAMNPYDCTGYRLLTEAEWEGAARCGTDLKYAGSDDNLAVAWTEENSSRTTHAVSGLGANACGVYDMSGNVWEWTQDWYGDYGSGAGTDPAGAGSGSDIAARGGGWNADLGYARVSNRSDVHPAYGGYDVGFRLSRSGP